MNIYYNVNGDYGLNYGLGHIYRAIEIIKILKKKSIACLVITESPDKVVDFLKRETKVKVIRRSAVKSLKINKSDLLINDTFGKDLKINSFFEKQNSKLINLDTTKINFKNGIIINSIIHYKKKVKTSRNIKYFGGFRYLIIRHFFKKKNKKIEKKNIFFVSSGGADFKNFLNKICSILLKMNAHKIYLMLGKAVKDDHIKKIKNRFSKETKVKILFNIKNPKKYLDKSKFALVSGGNILFESLSSNCLVMAVQNYFHQSFAIKYLEKKKCIINLGTLKKINKEAICKSIQVYENKLDNILTIRRKVIDYKGLDRVVNIIYRYIRA
jgi:spore coat polysaccharide biosynthesis predicted glycosyltransferase SpsG